MAVAVEEGVRVAVTLGGSPALYTGYLKENNVTVLHQVALVRHARAAEAQGVDIVIAEGFEGGGLRGRDEVPNLVLVPQIVDAVSVPVIASGGIADARGFVAALALGASGVQMGTRFVATRECIAHPKLKEAIAKAIDSGTIVAGMYHIPARVLRTQTALKLREETPTREGEAVPLWETRFGPMSVRAASLDGDLERGVAYAGASVGLVSDIVGAAQVVESVVKGAEELIQRLGGLRG
jgi:NAD(P)H-dependent flavin oxidoreductase YrpB (nitropropane dioxygenase family)